VVAFVNTQLDESASSRDKVIEREHKIISQFRKLRNATTLDPQSADMADILNIELRRLGLDIEIIELRERDSVWSCS